MEDNFCLTCINQHEGYFHSKILKAEVLSPCPVCRPEEFAQMEQNRQSAYIGKWNDRLDRDLGDYRNATFESIDLDRPFEPIMAGSRRISPEAQKAAFRSAVRAIRNYAEYPRGWLFIWGPRGGGKSLLAAAAANLHRSLRHSVAYASVPQLIHVLREGMQDYSTTDHVTYLQDADFVVIDDLGTEFVKDWADEQLYLIFNSRYQTQKPTIITSNYSIERLEEKYRDTAERLYRIVDRLKQAQIVSIPASSYREIKKNVSN